MCVYLLPGPACFAKMAFSCLGQGPIIVMVIHLNLIVLLLTTVNTEGKHRTRRGKAKEIRKKNERKKEKEGKVRTPLSHGYRMKTNPFDKKTHVQYRNAREEEKNTLTEPVILAGLGAGSEPDTHKGRIGHIWRNWFWGGCF